MTALPKFRELCRLVSTDQPRWAENHYFRIADNTGLTEWFYPVRESLGAALMLNGQAREAEAVFRADPEQYPRNPRSLFGLWKSLEAQQKTSNVESVRREFETAWKNADGPLEVGDL